jgi:hypothetical protein
MLLQRLDLLIINPKWLENYIILLVGRSQEQILEEEKNSYLKQTKQEKQP